jgi:choline dehydrogenase
VVGAGSAGATLAGRLSEDPNASVTLVEGGKDYRSVDTHPYITTTVMGPSMDTHELSDYFWLGYNAKRTNTQKDDDLYWRGKGVGGSSAINGAVAFRAPPDDHDAWTQLGIKGWSYAECLPYSIRLEDDVLYGDEWYHGRGGPVPVYRFTENEWSDLDAASVAAGARVGFGFDQPDINAPTGEGFGYFPNNSRDGRRVSCNDAYLEPARGRANLTIRSGLLADRLILDGNRAVGIRVIGPDGPEEIFGDEIVICGGTAGSAAIAMRSGIGPAAELRDLGIDVVADLPVGLGVQDHVALGFMAPMAEVKARGVLRPVVACRWSSGDPDGGRNDMVWNVSGPWSHPDLGDNIGSLLTQIYRPFSRGELHLVSTDPTIEPSTSINLMDDERDQRRLRDSVQRMVEIAAEPALAKCFADTPTNGLTRTTLAEAAALDAPAFRSWSFDAVRDLAHLVASCPMGAADGADTVVDHDCRPLGTEGVRIVDAAVLPAVTRANTNLPVIMMAEKMADVMLGRPPLSPIAQPGASA